MIAGGDQIIACLDEKSFMEAESPKEILSRDRVIGIDCYQHRSYLSSHTYSFPETDGEKELLHVINTSVAQNQLWSRQDLKRA